MFVSVGTAVGATGCATPRVHNAEAPKVYADSVKALATQGFDCKVDKSQIVCDENSHERATLFISYVPSGSRLVLVAFDRIAEPCEALLSDLNRFNYEFDFAQVSCKDGDVPMLFYVGSLIVPENGLTPRDLGSYVAWWTTGVSTAVRVTQLAKPRPDAPESGGERTMQKL